MAAVEYALRRLCSWLIHGNILHLIVSIHLTNHSFPAPCTMDKQVSAHLHGCDAIRMGACAGNPGPRHPDLEAAALGSAALVFFAGRASSPRDLSAAACTELRHACYEVLKDMY